MSYNKTKTNSDLGVEIHKYLLDKGVETPGVDYQKDCLERKEKIKKIEHHFTEIMKVLGLDLSDDSLSETPARVAKMYVNEIFWGLDPDAFPKATVIENKMKYDEIIIESNISVKSQCEHHFITIDGSATVAYIPKDKVLGLSKLNRIVEYFSRRPQVQERLTEQIFHALVYILGTEHVAVYIDAKHFCVSHRGVEDNNSSTQTCKLGGAFKNDSATRSEFLTTAKLKNQ